MPWYHIKKIPRRINYEDIFSFDVPPQRFELRFSQSKCDVLPIRRKGSLFEKGKTLLYDGSPLRYLLLLLVKCFHDVQYYKKINIKLFIYGTRSQTWTDIPKDKILSLACIPISPYGHLLFFVFYNIFPLFVIMFVSNNFNRIKPSFWIIISTPRATFFPFILRYCDLLLHSVRVEGFEPPKSWS